MKCYFHVERDAVATCQDCGMGLCQECASKYTPCLCPECAEKRKLKNEQEMARNKRDHLYNVKDELFKTCFNGVFIAVVFIVIGVIASVSDHNIAYLEGFSIIAFVGFFSSFGWKFTVNFRPSAFESYFMQFVWVALRLVISFVIGIPCFIFAIIKYVNGVEKNRKM